MFASADMVDIAVEKLSGILVHWLVNDLAQIQSDRVGSSAWDFSSCVSKKKVTH